MVLTPFRLFLFAVAAFLAAGGTAYYTGALDAYFTPAARQAAHQEGGDKAGSANADTDKSEPDSAESEAAKDTAEGEDQQKSTNAQENAVAGKDERVIVPAFDIVRVEPDGSMVVAGHAAPGSNVEVVSGSTIVGRAQSGPDGDFAVVLDQPLDPGDHQIVLRSTSPQDVVATSKETALVSVPDGKNGEVLALVEAPGKPSRLITKPAARESAAKNEVAEVGNIPVDKRPTDKADAQAAGGKAEQPHVAMTEPSGGTANDGAAAPGAAGNGGAAKDSTTAPDETARGKKDDASAGVAADAGRKTPATEETASGTAQSNADNPAASDSAGPANAQTAGDKSEAKVFIEAVEIDGKDVFVAGGGVPGQRVRVYANDILLGDAIVSPNGRFLVQTTRELPVGDYIVRADLLSDNGADVIARAAVPFEREPGEKLAAVAPKSRSADAGGEDAPAAETSTGDEASKEGATAPRAPSSTSEGDAGQGGPASAPAGGENASAPAAAAASSSPTQEPAPTANAEGGMELPDLNNGLADSAPVITEPKLQTVDGAVIIRRGDTLWQISRRVYGHGVRFSTIYLANQEQIRDPDMIWPGQVFSVPQETKSGETADMKAIGDQAVPTEMAGTEPDWRR